MVSRQTIGSWNITSVSDRSCSGSSDTVSLLHGCAALPFEQLACCPSSTSDPSDKAECRVLSASKEADQTTAFLKTLPWHNLTLGDTEYPRSLLDRRLGSFNICISRAWFLKSDCPGRLILILVSRRRVRQCSWFIEGSDIEADNILAVPTSSWSTAVHEKPLQPVIFRVTKMLWIRAYHSHRGDPYAPCWLSPPPNGRKFCREFHNACDTWLPITNPVYSPAVPSS